MLTISEVNALDFEQFVSTFGNVVELCPLIAAAVWEGKPFKDVSNLSQCFQRFLDHLPIKGKIWILRCYPDLAGRLAAAGELSQESMMEHRAAGLDSMMPEEREKLNYYNKVYKVKFGFPFVVCARENKKDAILKGIVERCSNDKQSEVLTGTEEVKKICKLRILNIVTSQSAKL